MRLAVSNIAWRRADDERALELAASSGVGGIEVAPTVLWPDWDGATLQNATAYRTRLESRGLTCPALQSVFFGLPEHNLFGSRRARAGFADHLRGIALLANALGAGAVVFGSPRNRDRGSLSPGEARDVAVATFRELAAHFASASVTLCIEANPPEYGCNFVTRVGEAVELADAVDADGFGVHLDAGGIILADEGATAVATTRGALRHFHVSEPYLGSFEQPSELHAALADELDAAGYDGWRSIEMRAHEPVLDHVEVAIAHARARYFARERVES